MAHDPGSHPTIADDGLVDTVHDLVVESIDTVKPRLRGWLHAGTAPLAFLGVLVAAQDDTDMSFGMPSSD